MSQGPIAALLPSGALERSAETAPAPASDRAAWAWEGPAAVGCALAAFVAVLVGMASGGASIDVPWAPTLGLRLDFSLDGLGVLYALLATGIGLAVFAFGAAYMPWHLDHEGRPRSDARRFWPWMVLFMVAMVGLACSRDLILLFVFFDLTAVASYFLIGFDRSRRAARGAALMALLVTGVSAVAMLIGAVLLYAEYGTFSLPALIERADGTTNTIVAAALIAGAAMAKSAQVPLHFWLPRAMEAPTPVSAYLHSAAMVAAGVLVIGRIHPLLAESGFLLDALIVVGGASIVIGGLLALAQDELKQILAHSTISQYGYVVVLYGIGGRAGAGAASLYVLTHAIAKSALFMTAGAVAVATGETRLSRLGGLLRSMPVLGIASGLAASTLAALPLTLGFFKDEMLFKAASAAGTAEMVLAIVAAGLTFAYIGRFWFGTFAGDRETPVTRVPVLLVAPIVVLAAIALLGGVYVEPFAHLAEDAAAVTAGALVEVDAAYHLDARDVNLMAVAAWALGAALLFLPRVSGPIVAAVARAGDRFGPRRVYGLLLLGVNKLSDRVHDAEVRDLRTSLAAVFLPTGVLVALTFAFTPTEGVYEIGSVAAVDLPIIALLGLGLAAGITAARDLGRLRPVLAVSVLGFALAAVYAFMGAPDVALVAVVVETVLTLVFVGVYARLPPVSGGTVPARRSRSRLHRRNAIAAVVAGAGAFVTIWAALSRPSVAVGDAQEHVRLTPDAHGTDVVTVILADFRGFDTLVEITVLAAAVIGCALLLRRGKAW